MGKSVRRRRGNLKGCLLGTLLLLIGLAEATAFADSAWFNCSVNLVGPGKTETFISLTDLAEGPAFVDKWFRFPADRVREMLAAALSAINSDKKVVVVADPDSGIYPVVSEIFLRAQ